MYVGGIILVFGSINSMMQATRNPKVMWKKRNVVVGNNLDKIKIRIFKYSGISVAILILGFLAVAQITYKAYLKLNLQVKCISVNGGKIHMYCTGPENNEKPTIIIISGGGTASLEYFHLQEKLSQTVRTCIL